MNNLIIFENAEFGQIRTVQLNNETYFVGKDIADKLGYQNGSRDINRHVADEDRMSTQIEYAGQRREVTVINESGLYALIFGSKLESAKRFKHWVTSEVLPSIRKTGKYDVSTPTTYLEALEKLVETEKARLELENTVQQMDKVILEMTPKVDYVDRILSSADCMTITQIAQDYGMSAKRFNKILANACIQHKVGEQWILYADHQGKGYVRTRTAEYDRGDGSTGTKLLTVWTQKGRMFLYERLKTIGIYPDMEVANA